ncbi:SDR family NAD(P)-dependent oxidoreductase [Nostoc sp.]|uniref:SDR family NAD(P)-dependent oxidoreductase n=1 Tax=Nostoc sp. TaxID=1180 RepID=UPI002FF95C7A
MGKTLAGKVALVTGGSRGLGAAIAKRLAHDGAAVALTYTSLPQKADEVVLAIEAAGGKALALAADSADVEAVKHAIAETVKTLGRLDTLVNNAGVGAFAPIDQFSMDEFDRLVAVNIKGVFVATQEAIRHIEGGRIIMIGSVSSDSTPFTGISVYAVD